MSQVSPESTPAPPPRRAFRRVSLIALEAAVVGVTLAAVLGLVAYQGRKAVGRQMAEAWLRKQGVESAVEIERLDASGFAGRLRLGPAADPDLVAERIEVEYDFTAPWSGAPFAISARSVRLVRPRVKLAFDGKTVSFGSLDPLVRDLLRRPKTDKPAPDILIEEGLARLATPYGPIQASADAAFDDGKLISLDGGTAPAALRFGALSADLGTGRVRARGDGQAIEASLDLDLRHLKGSAFEARASHVRLDLADIRYDLVEGLRIRASGRARVAGEQAVLGGARLSAPVVDLDFGRLEVMAQGGRLSGQAGLVANLRVAGVERSGVVARSVSLAARLAPARWGLSRGRLAVSAPASATIRAARADLRLAGEPAVLRGVQGGFNGRLDLGVGGQILKGEASLRAAGGFTRPAARRLAAKVPVLSAEAPYAAAAEAALADFQLAAPKLTLSLGDGPVRLTPAAPIVLAGAGGVRATLTAAPGTDLAAIGPGGATGGFSLAVEGGGLPPVDLDVASYALRGGDLDARLALETTLDFRPAKGARIAADGRARYRGGAFTFLADRCVSIAADRLVLGETVVENPAGQACALGDDPLISATGGAWRLVGRLGDGKADVPSIAVSVREAAARVELAGGPDRPMVGRFDLTQAVAADQADPLRFMPLHVSGPVTLTGDAWQGTLAVKVDAGPVGQVVLRHDMAAGAGRADIDASGLAFRRDGLQPADLTPLVPFLSDAQGPASFTGALTWTKDTPPAGTGRLWTSGLDAKLGGIGVLTQVQADVALTSLFPVQTAPDQVLTVKLMDAVTQWQEARAVFDIAGGALSLDSGVVSVVGGRVRLEPMVIPFATPGTFAGTIVLDGVEMAELLGLTTLGDKVAVQATIDGRLPFRLGPDGFRFLKGEIAARGPGRISIKRTALSQVEAGAAQPAETVSAVQDFAYQAMENLAFETLSATVESLPEGRLGVLFHIKGEHDPEVAEEARIGLGELLDRTALQRRIPLPKGTPIDLTLDTSLNFEELIKGYRQAFETVKVLDARARSATVQPAAR